MTLIQAVATSATLGAVFSVIIFYCLHAENPKKALAIFLFVVFFIAYAAYFSNAVWGAA